MVRMKQCSPKCLLLVDRPAGWGQGKRRGQTSSTKWMVQEGAPGFSGFGHAPLYPVLHSSSGASPFQALFAILLLTLEDKTGQALSP